jgi:ABC-type antimicrobial peptide transport system permease subunit
VVQPLKEQVWALDPRLPIDGVETIAERLAASTSIATPRTAAKLLAVFSAVALALACVGVVGVVANAVGERRREIGVRMALGADAAKVRRLVLRHALVPVLFGAVLGAAGGIGIGRLLQSSLYETGSADPLTMLASTAVLIGFALLAAWWPARRATRIDPLDTLRAE